MTLPWLPAPPADPLLDAYEKFSSLASARTAARTMSVAALRARYAADFLSFCSLLEVLPKDADAGGPVPFVLTEIQTRFHAARSARDIVLKARQVKISTVELARDVWWWLCRPGAAVRIVVQSSTDHSAKNDFSKRIAIMLAALVKHGLKVVLESEAVGRWLLPASDGGGVLEIIEAGASAAAAGKKGRGGTTQRLHVTELAFFEYAGATLRAMKASVPKPETGSEIVYESTPNGMGAAGDVGDEASGGALFHRTWTQAEQGTNDFKPHFFAWYENDENRTGLSPGERLEPQTERERQIMALGCDQEQLKWYRAQVADNGQDTIDQEYPTDPKTCFLASGRPYFDKARVEAMHTACVEPLSTERIVRPGATGTLKVFALPVVGAQYVGAVDTSEGTGGDRGCCIVYEVGTGRHMATLWGQFKPSELARESEKLGRVYACYGSPAVLAVERNNHGAACLQELMGAAYPAVFYDHDRKPGWITHEVSRTPALAAFEQAIREGRWVSEDVDVVGELRTFVVSRSGKVQAAPGAYDDLVMCAAIGWNVLGRVVVVDAAEPDVSDMPGLRLGGGRGWG